MVTFVSQFENASVVHFNIDRNSSDEEHTYYGLSIEGEETNYDCRNDGGYGSRGHTSYTFIVSPALPDDITKYKLVFKEYNVPFKRTTGF